MTATRHLKVLAIAASCALGSGCDLFDSLEPAGKTMVQVFSTHHATPSEDGTMPNLGGQGEARVFDTDEGWTVTLRSGFITTSGVTLHSCGGATAPVDFYWGDLIEDLSDPDLDVASVGAAKTGPTEFCSVTVHYAPFEAATSEFRPRKADLDGTTIYLSGIATRDDERVEFEIRATGSVEVELDLKAANGGKPLVITGDEPFPVELTLSKTYDRFFDGIDFAALSDEDLEQQAMAVLELETRVGQGTVVHAG